MNKKSLLLALSVIMLLGVTGCTPKDSSEEESGKGEFAGQTLTIYNCEDYISSGDDDSLDVIGEFEKEYGCKVNYYTYDTNETMYNQFTLQKQGTYDLICTSEYMNQKMIKEKLVQPIDKTKIPNYYEYVSPSIQQKMEDMKVKVDGVEDSLDNYCVGYMWGTLGIIYDPECSETIQDDVQSWDVFWDDNYKDLISIKNSMRDTFVVGLMHSYSKDENFRKLMDAYLEDPNEENCEAYNDLIQNIFDFNLDGSSEADKENKEKIAIVKKELISLKNNIFGFEVDSGKNDIITGKIKMNLAWSGDAVYSITTALDEADKVLEYSVPLDGANIWYDGWTLPQGANTELAYKFLNYMSSPEVAAANMDYVGYTPFIAGTDLFDLALSYYGVGDYSSEYDYYKDEMCLFNNELYACIKDTEGGDIDPTNEEYWESAKYDEEAEYSEGDFVQFNGKIYGCLFADENSSLKGVSPTDEENWYEVEGYDLSYFFDGSLEEGRSAIIYPYYGSENQLETQYPTKEIIARCAIMNDFGSYNDSVIIMWGQVKAYTNMTPVYVFLSLFVLLGAVIFVYFIVKKKISARYKRNMVEKDLKNL